MNFVEEARVFPVAGEQLLGIVAKPDVPGDCGVLIIVGGPQYRVGSHRQFALLARSLAAEGYTNMRFDYRGMGDSSGAMRSFEEVSADVGAAIDALLLADPAIKRVVLWGLCDAASAALLYLEASTDARVSGVVLLNPWVRSETSLAQTHIKHYYRQRLLQREFWRKLMRGELQVFRSVAELLRNARLARKQAQPTGQERLSFQDRMAAGLKNFPGSALLILSGEDFTAKEFEAYVAQSSAWAGVMGAKDRRTVRFADADHTFSNRAHRGLVERETLVFLRQM